MEWNFWQIILLVIGLGVAYTISTAIGIVIARIYIRIMYWFKGLEADGITRRAEYGDTN